ncbi:polysaccharide biosynthesis tyrosine autokinase [uncultured Jatrophihabitans sp.]|uniref:polysaccharide biosynthesis tyrosine autokinase n=1 Tax=uncultured Jatrophihabitans sp. TaxID=1610747 RepID=UPI0035CC1255
MEFTRFVRAIRKSWWIIALLMIAFGGGALAYSNGQAPVYASHLKFYVGSPSIDDSSANSTNQFAEDRATSYAGLVSSDRLAERIAGQPGLPSSAGAISAAISASAQLNTVFIDVTVQDTSRRRAFAIASAVGRSFPGLVDELDNTQTGTTGATVKLTVVSGPSSSGVPVAPRTHLNVALGIALGLLLGLVIAAAREVLDNSVRSPEDLAALTGGPVLGVIGHERSISAHPLIIGEMSASPRAEAVRRIRTNLRFMAAASPTRVVVITSSVEGEGKSTISVNLALSIAESGRSVLLIEGDLRRPGVSRLMNIEGSIGLTNVLVGQTAIDDVLQPWGSTGLTVLPSGTLPPNPAELLGSPRMRELLTTLSARFDVVLIDSPPLLPVTDPALLAAGADGAIVVFRHGRTRRSQLVNALEQLESVDARVIGTVLNMRPTSRSDRRGYGHYYGAEPSKRWWSLGLLGLLRRHRPSAPAVSIEAFEQAVTAERFATAAVVDAPVAAEEVHAPAEQFDPRLPDEPMLDRAQHEVAALRRSGRSRGRRRLRLPDAGEPVTVTEPVVVNGAVPEDGDFRTDGVSTVEPDADKSVGEVFDAVPADDNAAPDVDAVLEPDAIPDGTRAPINTQVARDKSRVARENGSTHRTRTRHNRASREVRAARHDDLDSDDGGYADLDGLLETGKSAHRA